MIISAAVILSGVAIMGQTTVRSWWNLTEAWNRFEARSQQASSTGIDHVTHTCTVLTALVADFTFENTGRVSIHEFSSWDVFVEYYTITGDYYQKRLSHQSGASLANDEWQVAGIYRDAGAAQAEIFNPNILDPTEDIVLRLRIFPPARTSPANSNRLTLAVSNGVTLTTTFC